MTCEIWPIQQKLKVVAGSIKNSALVAETLCSLIYIIVNTVFLEFG